jgi:hypothetical protein
MLALIIVKKKVNPPYERLRIIEYAYIPLSRGWIPQRGIRTLETEWSQVHQIELIARQAFHNSLQCIGSQNVIISHNPDVLSTRPLIALKEVGIRADVFRITDIGQSGPSPQLLFHDLGVSSVEALSETTNSTSEFERSWSLTESRNWRRNTPRL